MPLMQGLAGRLVVYPPFFGLSDRACPALACPALRLTGSRSATNARPDRPSSGLSLVVYPPSLVYPTVPVCHFACPASILLSRGSSDLFGLCDLPCIGSSSGLRLVLLPIWLQGVGGWVPTSLSALLSVAWCCPHVASLRCLRVFFSFWFGFSFASYFLGCSLEAELCRTQETSPYQDTK